MLGGEQLEMCAQMKANFIYKCINQFSVLCIWECYTLAPDKEDHNIFHLLHCAGPDVGIFLMVHQPGAKDYKKDEDV